LKSKKIQALFLLGLFTAALLYYLWLGRYSYLHFPILVFVEITCLGTILLSHFLFKSDPASLGLRSGNFFRAGKWYGTLTIAGCLGIAVIGWNNPDWNLRITEEAFGYLVWAAVQQYALQNFFLRLSLVIFARNGEGDGSVSGLPMSRTTRILASLLSAAVFALFHFPSPPFVVLTFTAAFIWCLIYTVRPSFYWAWISHFVLGLCLSFFLKAGVMGNLQVGPGGFRYEAYGDGVSVASGYGGDGSPFIAAVPGPDRGNASLVRIFSPGGKLLTEWTAFREYDFSAMISAGDVGFGPGDEIIAVPGPGPDNPPAVRIFNLSGQLLKEFRINDPDFSGSYGAWVYAAGGNLFLGPGPGPRVAQVVAEFTPDGNLVRKWNSPEGKIGGHLVFRNGLRGVVKAGPEPLLFRWGSGISVNPSTIAVSGTDGENLRLIETLPTTYGINMALLQLGEGNWGVAVTPGPLRGYPPWVKVFSAGEGLKKVRDMVPWESEGSCGANISAVDINGDGVDELVMGEGWGRGRPATIRILTLQGEILHTWDAF
jgi:Type II CAAX prenyl endopeptidase Rce1-like